ncbi:MAG: carboxypeptidase regulatory-like domain-containing protein [Terriglobales bacterium]
MRMRPISVLLAFLLAIVLPTNELNAQTTTSGGLTGVVTDKSGAVLPSADVEIKDTRKGNVQSTRTDREGVYRFFFLAPSPYTLTVAHEGFQEERRTVNILLGPPGTVNVMLEIAKTSSEVTVTDEAPLIQAENGDASTTMNQQQISEVPNPGNDLTYIAQTAPGAIMNTEPGGVGNVSILGMPGPSNQFTLNGMNNNFNFLNANNSGALGMMLGQNEVQEASVVNNGYSAQFGGAAGSNINYITKSGGNAFHGNAAWYWNGRALNANDWIDNAEGNPRPFDIANQWAGSIGGPILKDKLFFFFDTEGMHLVLPQPTYVTLPSAAFESATMANIDSVFGQTSASHNFYRQVFDLYDQTPGAGKALPGNFVDPLGCSGWTNPNDPNDPNGLGVGTPCAVHFFENLYHSAGESIVSGRVDWNIGAQDRLFVLAQYDHGRVATWIDPISSAFDAFIQVPWWQGQVEETHTINSTAANQLLLAGTSIDMRQNVEDPAKTEATFPTVLSWCNAGCPFTNLGGLDWANAQLDAIKGNTYQISDDLMKTEGRHKFGTGIGFLRRSLSGGGYNFSGTGQLLPQTLNAFFYGGTAPSNPEQDFTTLIQTFPIVTWNRLNYYSLGLYVQDEWHLRSNFSLTIALRGDHQSNPVCTADCFPRMVDDFYKIDHDVNVPYNQVIQAHEKQAFAHTDRIAWSPRLSFAWQPLGVSQNLVLRGGIGIFYDPVPGLVSAAQSTNFPVVNTYTITGYNLAPADPNSLTNVASASNAALISGFAAGDTLGELQKIDPTFSPPAFYNAPHTLHTPQFQKWSLQAQQNFRSSVSLTIGYFGNHGSHEFIQDSSANAHNFGSYPSAPCGSPPVAPCYDTRFGQVQQFASNAISNYNGMVVSFEKQVTHWGSGVLQVNYTYGHALDEVSNGGLAQFNFGSSLSPQDGRNLRGNYGASDYDARHSVNGSYVWEVPFKQVLGRGSEAIVKGWQVSGTVIARTGFPYTVIDYGETGNLVVDNVFNPVYAVPVGPIGPQASCGEGAVIPAAPHPCLPAQVLPDGSLNPGALFVQTGCETGFNTGNLGASGVCNGPLVTFAQGRNRFRGPGYVTTDLAIMKSTPLPHWENSVFGVGFQFFNLFNHPNFGFPDNSISDTTFGRIFYQTRPPTSVLGSGANTNVSARMIQVKAQLRF